MRVHKYNAISTKVDGIFFASKKEAKRYGELKLLEKAGEISDLRLQTRWPLFCGDTRLLTPSGRVMVYISDFDYRENDELIIEDPKGMRTEVYRIKKAIMQANGYEIRET